MTDNSLRSIEVIFILNSVRLKFLYHSDFVWLSRWPLLLTVYKGMTVWSTLSPSLIDLSSGLFVIVRGWTIIEKSMHWCRYNWFVLECGRVRMSRPDQGHVISLARSCRLTKKRGWMVGMRTYKMRRSHRDSLQQIRVSCLDSTVKRHKLSELKSVEWDRLIKFRPGKPMEWISVIQVENCEQSFRIV